MADLVDNCERLIPHDPRIARVWRRGLDALRVDPAGVTPRGRSVTDRPQWPRWQPIARRAHRAAEPGHD